MLFRMTQIDYDREMAMVAIEELAEKEIMVGAARIINDPDGTGAEFAIMVGDPWQGHGIGAALLETFFLPNSLFLSANVKNETFAESEYVFHLLIIPIDANLSEPLNR
jgi:GNAT superfamily N-acetyltransferase